MSSIAGGVEMDARSASTMCETETPLCLAYRFARETTEGFTLNVSLAI